jgi:outer membrane protein TolC
MSRNYALIAIAALVLSRAVAASAAEYDLAAYLARVEAANPDLALARCDLEAAKEGVVQARSALLPAVALQGGYTRNLLEVEQPKAVAANPTTGAFIYQDIDTNYDNEITLGLGVQQKIFDAEAIARYEQARKGRAAQYSIYEVARRNIRAAAKKLYAQTQLALAVVEVDETSEHTAEENYRSAEKKFRAGVTTELEMLTAEVDWKSRIPSTAEARKNAELAMIALKNLAGIPLAEDIVLTEDETKLPDDPLDPSLDEVLAARPDYAACLVSKEIADIARKAAYGSFLPTVAGSFSYGYYDGKGSDILPEYDVATASLGLKVTIPLFAGGYRLSLMAAAKNNQAKAATTIIQKRDDVERELVSVRLRLDEARRRIDSARLVEATARRAADLAKLSFTNGLATQLQVSQAATGLDQAQLGLQNAIYQYKSAFYDWELATGKAD